MEEFDAFADEAAALFGLNENEAATLLDYLEAVGFDLEQDTLQEYGEEAVDWLEYVSEDIAEAMEEVEGDWDDGDDPWLDPEVEYEVSVEYEEAT